MQVRRSLPGATTNRVGREKQEFVNRGTSALGEKVTIQFGVDSQLAQAVYADFAARADAA
jgi:hypothetical protein